MTQFFSTGNYPRVLATHKNRLLIRVDSFQNNLWYSLHNDVQEGNFEWKRFIIYRTSGSSRTLYKCIRASSTNFICTIIATITTLFPMLTSRTCLQFRCWWCRTVRSIRTFIFNYTTRIMSSIPTTQLTHLPIAQHVLTGRSRGKKVLSGHW